MDRSFVIKLALGAVVLGVIAVLSLRGLDWKLLVAETLNVIRGAGPLVFFSGMALLPAFGFPLSPFTLSAGPAFAPSLGLPAVIAATCGAIAVNVLVTYAMARWLLRPVAERLVVRLGYRMPTVRPDNQWDVAILLRVTPGPPFFVQSYLLGLARVPLAVYMIASVAVAWSYAVPFVIFGDAVLQGQGRMVMFGLSLMAALGVGIHLLRKHLARKRALAAA